MKTLTKKYRLIYDGENILNDYQEEKEGITYVGKSTASFEADTLEEVEQFVTENKLVEKEVNIEE